MMMLQGTKHSDSPAVDARPKEVTLLPPLSTNRKCIKDCDSDEDCDEGTRTAQFLNTRWRAKSKRAQDRLALNKSSMSDSFVLPRINGSLQSTTEHHERSNRKSRTSLSYPKRTWDTCIPFSKSCPALMNNTWRRSSRGESPDYEYEDDTFEGSDDDERDLKSKSYNTEVLRTCARKSNSKVNEHVNHHNDITEGVVCKLAKLESPQSKNYHAAHLQERSRYHSKSKEADTMFPNIFNPNGLSQQLFKSPDQAGNECDNCPQSSQENTRVHQSNIKVPRSLGKSTNPESRVSDVDGTKDNSDAMDYSPWDTSAIDKGKTGLLPVDDVDRQSNITKPTRAAKKKQKQKRQRPVGEQERPHLPRDVSQADIKCINWLAEGQQENTSQLTTSEQPKVT